MGYISARAKNECSALFGYAVWAEIDFCEKHAPKSPCIQMK